MFTSQSQAKAFFVEKIVAQAFLQAGWNERIFRRPACPAAGRIGHLVLIDPLVLDGLSQQLAEVGQLPVAEQISALQALGEHGLRIGAQMLGSAAPGTYELGLHSFEAVDEREADAAVFDIDTGTVIVIDGGALSAVARAFTWDRYDRLLQAPVGDASILVEINEEVGGPRFAIVSADAGSSFSGDGAFRLRPKGLIPVP